MFEPLFGGFKKSRQIPAKFPAKFPCKKKITDKVSAGMQENFLGQKTARWGGGLPREGVVVEKFVPSPESLSSLGFAKGGTWDVLGILLGCPGPLEVFEKFVQKRLYSFFGL